jgi:hypothetical protein
MDCMQCNFSSACAGCLLCHCTPGTGSNSDFVSFMFEAYSLTPPDPRPQSSIAPFLAHCPIPAGRLPLRGFSFLFPCTPPHIDFALAAMQPRSLLFAHRSLQGHLRSCALCPALSVRFMFETPPIANHPSSCKFCELYRRPYPTISSDPSDSQTSTYRYLNYA